MFREAVSERCERASDEGRELHWLVYLPQHK